jgi:hypothetical protein
MIGDLVASVPGMRANGFWADVRNLAAELDVEIGKYSFLPDAHHFNRDSATIELHEVVVTNDPARKALFAMADFWFDWDSEGTDWDVALYVHREGAAPQAYDLRYWWNESERAEVARLSEGADHAPEIAA